ncbi:nucleotide exchange factor GrpE [Candidatus Bathyarchaeota archaeon RBG_13_52_12]|nr:MAG: nucleotide exchange factor GrpE [Candidatus Bathyarchaeota archaeon RBG_13_52_12]
MSPDLHTKPKRRTDEKIAELERQLAEARTQADAYLNQLKYTKADLDNLQKQIQKRIEESTERNNARILGQLITLADELSLVANTTKNDAIAMINGKLLKLLQTEGVAPMECKGKPFDPYRHEAVLEVEEQDCPAGTIIEEIRSGYSYKDKVLRAAMVKVAKAPGKKEEKDNV